jgi:hypothetical protein
VGTVEEPAFRKKMTGAGTMSLNLAIHLRCPDRQDKHSGAPFFTQARLFIVPTFNW